MIVTFWKNLLDPVGSERNISWTELVDRLSRKTAFLGDNEHPGWSPVKFVPCQRAQVNVKSVFALTLDYDHGGEAIDALARRIGAEAGGLVHTTRKHASGAPRYRVVLPLSRPVSGFEFRELWIRFAPWAGQVDQAPKDPSRFWYLPGSIGGEFEAREIPGDNIDVDKWLSRPDPTIVVPLPPRQSPQADIERRAEAYLEKIPGAVAGQGGHSATWQVAVALVRGFGLDELQAMNLMRGYNMRCEPPWTEKELAHKVAGAMKADRVPLGHLAGQSRACQPNITGGRLHVVSADDQPIDYGNEPEREAGDDSADIAKEAARRKTAAETFGVVEFRALCEEVVIAAKTAGPQRGFTTGIEELDEIINGLRSEHITLLAAGTSFGKTSMGIMVADQNLRLSVPVLIVSVEDSKLMYGKRLMARRAGVNAIRLRNNSCTPSDIAKLEDCAMNAQPVPFFMSGIGKDVEWAAAGIRAMCREHGIKLVICDYVQRFTTTKHGSDRRNQVTYVAAALSDAIKESKAAGILISQLKRIEGREPTMDDVKESGDLENMAEHVVLGWSEKGGVPFYEGQEPPKTRYIKVPKNKDGPTMDAKLKLDFDELTASFRSLKSEHADLGRVADNAPSWYGDE